MKILADNSFTICGIETDYLPVTNKVFPTKDTKGQDTWKHNLSADSLFLSEESFGAIVIDNRSGHEAFIDREGLLLLRKFLRGENVKSSAECGFLESLSCYLSGKSPALLGIDYTEAIPGPVVLDAPLFIRWEITSKCNLACKHCYNDYSDTMGDLDTAAVLALMETFDKAGVFQLRIGGGEPFTRKDILILLKHAQEASLRPSVVTNGTLIDATTAKQLADMGIKDMFVSLDGPCAEVHDIFRGMGGAFDDALAGIRYLVQEGINIAIQSCLHDGNIGMPEEMVDLAIRLGARAIVFKLPVMTGRAIKSLSQPKLTELLAFAARVKVLKIKLGTEIHIGDLELSIRVEGNKANGSSLSKSLSCGPGLRTCSLRPDGRMGPCHYLQDERWLTEPIAPDTFLQLWRESAVFSPFRELRAGDLDWCLCCTRYLQNCSGGCRARGFLSGGEFASPDPYCFEKRDYPGESESAIRLLASCFAPSSKVLWRDLCGRVVAYMPETDRFLMLTNKGSRFWKMMPAGGESVDSPAYDYGGFSLEDAQKVASVLFRHGLLDQNTRNGGTQ